jgi:putative transport protein
LPEAEKTRLLNNIPVAYAVSYLVGTSFVVWFLSNLAPRLLKVDLKAEARALEAQAAAGLPAEAGTRSAYREWDVRAFRLPKALAGRRVEDVEKSFAPARVFMRRIRRGKELLEGAPDTVLQPGDIAVVGARRHVLLAAGAPFGEEVEDRELLDVPMAALDVVVTRRDIAERPLAEIAEEHGRGVVLLKLVRAGEEIPFAPGTLVNRGDLLRLAGAESDVERAGEALGYVERASSATDVVFVGLGILLGGLFGTDPLGTCRSASPRAAARSSWGSSSAGCARCAPPSAASRSPPSGSSTRSASPSSSAAWASPRARASSPACARPGRASSS